MSSQMAIGRKLTHTFGALVLFAMGLSYVSFSGMRTLNDAIETAYAKDAKKLDYAGEINVAGAEMLAMDKAILLGAYTKNSDSIAENNRSFDASKSRMEKAIAGIKPLLVTDDGRRSVDIMEGSGIAWTSQHDEMIRLVGAGRIDAALKLHDETIRPLSDEVNKAAAALAANVWSIAQASKEQSNGTQQRARWLLTALIGLSLFVGAVGFVVVQQINKSLRQAVAELSEGAEQVASAASQVSSSSQSLAQGSSEQAASLEETSASSEEINSMARKNTENSRSAADLVTRSQQKFVETNQALQQTVAAMAEINTQSGKISKIIKVIDEIAFQTNILALNAAVEAARAGEAGMGFAVVADEVRNLAQRCAQAAKDTASLIEDSIAKSNDGKSKVDQVAAAIVEITGEAASIRTLVDEVNLGSQEQARGIEHIGKAISQMEQVTQKTAANAEESASAAEELTAQSEALKDVVERLTAMVGGGGPVHRRARSGQRRADAAKAKSRHGATESASGVSAPRNAGPRQWTSGDYHAPAGKEAFPLEEQFKEF